MASVLCNWVENIPLMQQSVLIAAMRAPDGMAKKHPAKMLIRWFRRCVVRSAFDNKELTTPWEPGGGSYTGPSFEIHKLIPLNWDSAIVTEHMHIMSDDFIRARDEMTLHYYAHFMHGAEIIGYQHPNEDIRLYWAWLYDRMVRSLHLNPETKEQMNERLGDSETDWRKYMDFAGPCSD